LEIQCHIHEADQYRNLDQGADDGGEGGTGVDAEDRHGHGYRQLEVVA
jgi:hypothetical protein